ncbi:MAG TPA: hypothetical protein VFV99_17230 [Kofleriaceae bacterium]|nr:hypothetical protein [Kofleriaceae bacterium]
MVCLLVLALSFGCKKKPTIAELTKADGPVERQENQGPWGGANIGQKFHIGDAARTADGAAELKLVGVQLIKMEKYTVLRFGGGKDGSAKITVELGAIVLKGGGNYGLDVGDVKLGNDGEVRIAAKGQGKSTIELLVGNAQIDKGGQTLDLEIGKVLDLDLTIGPIKLETPIDAGVDAAGDGGTDAGVIVSEDGTIEVTGKKAEILQPGQTKWAPLPAGAGQLVKGAKVRLGNGTTAKLIANGVTLSMAGGSRTAIADDLHFGLELGVATASVEAQTEGKVGVPGGTVGIKGTEKGPGKARLDVNAKGEAKIAVLDGTAKLTGSSGADLEMKTGESASMQKAGAIHQTAKIPDYYDMRVMIGETPTFTIHDPKGATALQFAFNGKCNGGGTIEMDNDPRFRTARISGGRESANIIAEAGAWSYRLVCSGGGAGGSGRIIVRKDSGTRPLPKDPPVNPIDADGRTYRISYQSLIPNVKVKAPGGPGKLKLHLATSGTEETFDSEKPTFTLDGKKLKEATYTYWVERDGVKQDKASTLIINFDQTAPQVYIEQPQNGKPFGAEVDVKGAVLPGWSAKVDAVEIPIDKNTRRFTAKVTPTTGPQALAIRLSHPQRGVHFYLRRGK